MQKRFSQKKKKNTGAGVVINDQNKGRAQCFKECASRKEWLTGGNLLVVYSEHDTQGWGCWQQQQLVDRNLPCKSPRKKYTPLHVNNAYLYVL